jgi:hypothetical protein
VVEKGEVNRVDAEPQQERGGDRVIGQAAEAAPAMAALRRAAARSMLRPKQ